MKKILVFIFPLFCLQNLCAQDEIFLTNNSKLEVKVIEADSAQVKYTLKSDPNGAVHTESAKHIKLIYYEDGSILNYSHPEKAPKPHKYNEKEGYFKTHYNLDVSDSELTASKNIIFVNVAEILNSSVGISYWRELCKNRLAIQLSAGTGFSSPFFYNLSTYDYHDVLNFHPAKKAFEVGGGLYFSTTGKRMLSHFIGFGIKAAQYNGTFQTTYQSYIIDTNGQLVPVANYENHGFVYNESYAFLNNCLMFRISPHFDLMLNVAVGMRSPKHFLAGNPNEFYISEDRKSIDAAVPNVQVGFHFGYRF